MRFSILHSKITIILLPLFLLFGKDCSKRASENVSVNENQSVLDSPRAQPTPPLPKTVNPKPTAKTLPSDEKPGVLSKEDIVSEAARIEDFSPKNWYLAGKAEGNLNGDNLSDAVAVFSKAKLFDGNTEGTYSSRQSEDIEAPRLLVIALRSPDRQLKLSLASQKAILCRACGGAQMDDPFLGVSVKDKNIIISQSALGTSSADYLHKIKYSAENKWIVFYGEGKYRNRATGKITGSKQKGTIPLDNFDVTEEVKKLNLSSRPLKKTKK